MNTWDANLRRVVAIAVVGLRQLFRDRSNIFFVLIFPILLVLVLGTVFGSDFRPAMGVVVPQGDGLAADFVAELDDADEIDVERYDSVDDLRSGVERGAVRAGVVIPDGYGARLSAGETAEVEFMTRPSGVGAELQTVVQAAIGDQSVRLQAAQFAASQGDVTFDEALAEATERGEAMPRTSVQSTTVGEELFPEQLGRFGQGASSQILLFMFVTGLASSSALILSRQLGVSRRMLSTPTPPGVVLVGEALGRFVIVAFQGLYILMATWLFFGVDWGDPIGALAILVTFAAVATGAAMLAGALFRNDQQASGVGVIVGLGLAALGGCMAPLAVFSDTMRKVAHITPHAWAQDGFTELINHNGNVVDVLPELGVLVAMAAALLTLGTRQLRRAITR